MKIVSLQKNTTIRHGKAEEALSVVVDDNGSITPLTINADHPNWDRFTRGIEDYAAGTMSNSDLASLFLENFNLSAKAQSKFVKIGGILDGRMTLENDTILVDHAPIDPALEGHILRLLRADGTPKDAANWRAFAKFVENLYANTSEFVREQFFGWLNYENLKGRGFTLTDDGCFIGYKGCAGTPEAATSINTGEAIVNGVYHNGAIPNPLGAVVEMPRHKVQDDPNVGCSTGLHVGTYDYANSFQRGVLLTVKVNPRDVVSVPTECAAQKIRTCRYEVLEVVETAYEEATWSDDEEDCCGWCGEDTDDCACDETDDIRPGDEITFTYRKKNGEVKDYTVTVSYADRFHIEGENADGNFRTFVRSNVSSVRTAQQTASSVTTPQATPAKPTPTQETTTPPASASEDRVVSFTYRRRDGQVKRYEVKVTNSDKYYLDGELTDGGGFRTFLKSNISDLKTVTADGATGSEGEEEDPSATPPAAGRDFVDLIMTTLGGVISDFITVVDDGDDEDPGDDEDQEIRRNGYGDSDPWK